MDKEIHHGSRTPYTDLPVPARDGQDRTQSAWYSCWVWRFIRWRLEGKGRCGIGLCTELLSTSRGTELTWKEAIGYKMWGRSLLQTGTERPLRSLSYSLSSVKGNRDVDAHLSPVRIAQCDLIILCKLSWLTLNVCDLSTPSIRFYTKFKALRSKFRHIQRSSESYQKKTLWVMIFTVETLLGPARPYSDFYLSSNLFIIS
jgi:hypothetical protein